jgi:N-acetylmuramoyl-L-alanine amidase
MTSRLKPLMVAVAGAGMVSMGALVWLARDPFGSPSAAGARPSLMELLDEVRQSPGQPRRPSRPAPLPPRRAAWSSPLAAGCPAVDPLLRARLIDGQARLRSRTVRIGIDPSNYGERFRRDAFGNPVDPTPRVIVLHETVYGLGSAINTFLTPHPRDEDQVSYHTLIGGNGQVVKILDPLRRAFGAGNSAFNGQWVVTNPQVGGSVNNFALHLSLETPLDGEDDEPGHSGYTEAQYDAMALVLADWMGSFRIPPQNITTHRHVDLAGERADPRSFDWTSLRQRLAALGFLC